VFACERKRVRPEDTLKELWMKKRIGFDDTLLVLVVGPHEAGESVTRACERGIRSKTAQKIRNGVRKNFSMHIGILHRPRLWCREATLNEIIKQTFCGVRDMTCFLVVCSFIL